MAAVPAVLLMGPTAAGKSALALALAERLGGEIVSVDSAQVYRGLDVGTAKPDAATRARVPHHLIDVLDPTQAYSAARFAREALAAIADIRRRGRVPIVAGGTMLYFRALSEGLSALPAADSKVRDEIDARRRARAGRRCTRSWRALIRRPRRACSQPTRSASSARSKSGACPGVPLSALQGRRAIAAAALGATLRVALVPSDRKRLHEAIARRFDAMLAAGLVDELRALRGRYALTPELPSMRCVGYRQAWEYLEGRIDAQTLRARGIAATRQLAKRQFTWLRATDAAAVDPYAEAAFDRVLAMATRACGVNWQAR